MTNVVVEPGSGDGLQSIHHMSQPRGLKGILPLLKADLQILLAVTHECTAMCKAKPCVSDQDPTYATSREDSSGCTLSRAARQEREDAQYKMFYIAALSVCMLMEICGAIYLVIWLDDASRKDVLLVLTFGIRTFDMTSDWGTFRELYPRR